MTFREKLMQEHPEDIEDYIDEVYIGGCYGCPSDYGYEANKPCDPERVSEDACSACWDREMPVTPEEQEAHDRRINEEILFGYCDQYECSNCPACGVCKPNNGECWDAPDYDIHKQMAVLDAFEGALPPLDEDDAEQTDAPQDDPVNHPNHYTSGKVECIDAIESAIHAMQGERAFLTGQVIKYLWRWPLKNGVEDLRKARWYLDRLIKFVEDVNAERSN